jgi:tetratricopeptide (TPR) repeat protein
MPTSRNTQPGTRTHTGARTPIRTRSLAVALSLALSVTLLPALPAGAAVISEKDVLKQADELRFQRRNQEAVELLSSHAGSTQNPEVFFKLGQSQRELRTPADCLKAVEWYTKAIELNPTNLAYYRSRSGAYDCLGREYLVERLADRQRVVDMQESAGKSATPGDYADLASAHNALVAAGDAVDFERAKTAVDFYSRAIGLDNGRIGTRRDRADVMNARFKQPGVAASDYMAALELNRTKDMSVPQNARDRAVTARRLANLGTEALRSAVYGAQTLSTRNRVPNVMQAQLRNEAIEYYSKFIDAFEDTARTQGLAAAFADTRFGRGNTDPMGALGDRASVYNAMGARYWGKALADYQRRVELEPREPDYWFNLAQQHDRMGNPSGVRAALRTYFELVNGGPKNSVRDARALQAKHGA